jgi:hypothetical protein
MLATNNARTAQPGHGTIIGTPSYQRHCPEQGLLYQLVEQHYPRLLATLVEQDQSLPKYVREEFEAYLKCGRLEHGFLRLRCEACHAEKLVAFSCKRRGFCPSCGAKRMVESAALLVDEVLPFEPMRQWVLSVPYPLRFLFAREPKALSGVLGVVYRTLASHLIKQANLTHATAHTGAVTLIQRFGSALNLNVHLHLLVLDGAYERTEGGLVFRRVPSPIQPQLQRLLDTLSHRIGRYLARHGWLVRDEQSGYLALNDEPDGMDVLRRHSLTYRIAVGRHQGKKAFALQTLPSLPAGDDPHLAKAHGFSLHAGVWAGANDRQKLEHLCRYISRPAVANERIELTECGHVRYRLKTPYRDGTTHVYFSPLDFMARLAALVPKPRVNLTRFHGVFAPNSSVRGEVVKSKRGRRMSPATTPAEKRQAMNWAQRLKRVFRIDIKHCACGGPLKLIASIEDPVVIHKILDHLDNPARGPPVTVQG